MKKLQFSILLVTLLLMGCDSLGKLTQFDMPFSASVTVPASSPISLPLNIPTPDIETNSESFFSTNKIDPDLIDKVALKKLELSITSPTNGNFNFLESIEVYINAEGYEETKIAWLNNVPKNGATTLELTVDQTDFKKYILKDKFSLKVRTTTDELITTNHTIDIKTLFLIDVKVLGL